MNPFFQALQQGFSPEDILGYISKAIPSLSSPVKKATKAGYNIKQIVGFLSKNFDTQDRRGMTETERHAANKRSDAEMTKYGLKIAGTAIAAPLAASAAQAAVSRAVPLALQSNALQSLGSNIPSTPNVLNQNGTASVPMSGMNPPQNLASSSQQPPVNAPTLPQGAQPIQPKGIINPKEILEKKGVLADVDRLLKSGNNAQGVAAALGIKRSGEAKIDPELQAEIEAYAKEMQATPEAIQPEVPKEIEPEKPIEQKPMEKGSTVSVGDDVGEVKEIRGDKALVEVDGKIKKVDVSELEESPIPGKDLADLYDDLISGIEGSTGEDVSRMVQWAGYDPKTNTLQFLPHTGKLYSYGDISEEDAKLLTDVLSTRKSSGENFIGAWKAGSKSPIGAALSKLIKKLQGERGGKGNEYEASYETLYSAYEPAIQAKKKKKK